MLKLFTILVSVKKIKESLLLVRIKAVALF